MQVSIHTPTKGVTLGADAQLQMMISFNPHTHEGCDLTMYPSETIQLSFNPHTHEGCDFVRKQKFNYNAVSIHTPTKGVTDGRNPGQQPGLVSIHTPTKGVTF